MNEPTTYQDPDAPPQSPAGIPEKKSDSWGWLWPYIVTVITIKFFGIAGGLVTFGSYYWLKPKLGAWDAVIASGVIGAGFSFVAGFAIGFFG